MDNKKDKENNEDEDFSIKTKASKQDIKKSLLRKPTTNDWINMILFIAIFYLAWAYTHDVKALVTRIGELEEICKPILQTVRP